MNEEVNIGGVFLPALLQWAAVAVLVSVPIRRALALAGVYRFVWHKGLFDISLYIILWGGLAWLAAGAR